MYVLFPQSLNVRSPRPMPLTTLTIANPIKYIATIWNATLFIIIDMVKA